MKHNLVRTALTLVLALTAFSSALAQFSGSISGTVQDPAGAVTPGASVTLTNVGTGEAKTTKANGAGFYQFVSLAPGGYQVMTAAQGFADALQKFTQIGRAHV